MRSSSNSVGGSVRVCSASSDCCAGGGVRRQRGRVLSAWPDRRGRSRPDGPADQARVPARVAGHAAYGNLHFTLTAKLSEEVDRERYGAFMSDLVAVVVDKYDGSLKAEHGTGINMAPFVSREWGEKATAMMWRIKELADPRGVLGPNVVLSRDPDIHLQKFKSTPAIEQVATLCIECGFCEAACPSRNVTATPRQRIVLRREMARQAEGSPLLGRLQEEFEYDGIETCAVDGMCAVPCPLHINTGALTKEFRRAESTARREKVALAIAKRWATVEKLARTAMGAADVIQRTLGSSARRLDRNSQARSERRPGSHGGRTDAAPRAADASGDVLDRRCRGVLPRVHQPDLRPRP